MEKYDCTNDVMAHRERVAYWLKWIIECLEYRAAHHDESKLQPPEKEIFDEYTPKLKTMELGSKEYQAALEAMGEGLKHHYKSNPHHPEFHRNGVDGMAIWDVVEMIADWMAAASTKKSVSNKHVDLGYLQNRFNLSPQLRRIIANTLWAADMDTINYRVPFEYMPMDNFLDPNDESLKDERSLTQRAGDGRKAGAKSKSSKGKGGSKAARA